MWFAPLDGLCVRNDGCGAILSAFFVRDVVDCCRRAVIRATQQVAAVVAVAVVMVVVCKLVSELIGLSSDRTSILLSFFLSSNSCRVRYISREGGQLMSGTKILIALFPLFFFLSYAPSLGSRNKKRGTKIRMADLRRGGRLMFVLSRFPISTPFQKMEIFEIRPIYVGSLSRLVRAKDRDPMGERGSTGANFIGYSTAR